MWAAYRRDALVTVAYNRHILVEVHVQVLEHRMYSANFQLNEHKSETDLCKKDTPERGP